jgi:predicted dinucleotide-binding enzyme
MTSTTTSDGRQYRLPAWDAKGKARFGTPREAAQEADAVLLAVHWSRIEDVLNQTGDLSGKVIVTTCSLPMNQLHLPRPDVDEYDSGE